MSVNGRLLACVGYSFLRFCVTSFFLFFLGSSAWVRRKKRKDTHCPPQIQYIKQEGGALWWNRILWSFFCVLLTREIIKVFFVGRPLNCGRVDGPPGSHGDTELHSIRKRWTQSHFWVDPKGSFLKNFFFLLSPGQSDISAYFFWVSILYLCGRIFYLLLTCIRVSWNALDVCFSLTAKLSYFPVA